MKKHWKKEQKMCSRCNDKPAISFKHGHDAVLNVAMGWKRIWKRLDAKKGA